MACSKEGGEVESYRAAKGSDREKKEKKDSSWQCSGGRSRLICMVMKEEVDGVCCLVPEH